jgi:endonuclease/exonuclease/phosphatase family metal-dependent hydrolase
MNIKIATYNLHGGVGMDGRYAPERILNVLRELDAAVLAVQELQWNPHESPHLLEHYAQSLGSWMVPGPTLLRHAGHFGNALFTRLAIRNVRSIDLSVPGHEPRGALDVVLECPPDGMRVVSTHLGLSPSERRFQVKRLLVYLCQAEMDLPTALIGDINEWFLWGRPLRWLHRHFAATPARATWPSCLPVLALDRIWLRPRQQLMSLRAHRSPLARLASDHLPLWATLNTLDDGNPDKS